MLVCDEYNFLLLPKMLVLNPKDGNFVLFVFCKDKFLLS